METKNNKSEKKGFLKKFIDEVTTNVKEGASLVGEKVAEGALFVGEKVAETSAKAYVAGSDLVAETSDKIHDFTDKQMLNKEEHKLEARQKELKDKFGDLSLGHYLKNESLHKPFLTSQPISEIIDEFKANEKRMKVIIKEIKKLEKH